MVAIGGSIQEISLSGRIFPVASDAESQRKKGGFENEVQSNGDGSVRLVKTRVPFMLDGLVIEIDDVRGDHEFLQNLADQNDLFVLLITYASGISYQGNGQIIGDFQVSSQNATATLSLSGELSLTKQ